jgi:alpha-glucosidase
VAIPTWWQDAILYQIYPRSFADGNGDGIGDILGMIDKLDYLKWLGINALWISPFYPSPLDDVGYDIADYMGVAPEYGTLADFDQFLLAAHHRGIRVLLDLVLNHTSYLHSWFQESKSSRDNPYRDWYIWRDGKNGGPPNNWESGFGGSAWTYDETTDQYYYHYFFPQQPDLNWRNPEVRAAMFDAIRFWLDRGVDGFRLDAISTLFEDESLHDAPESISMGQYLLESYTNRRRPTPEQFLRTKFQYQRDMAETYQLMGELRRFCDGYEDRVLLGETRAVSYYGTSDSPQLHSVFNFDLTNVGTLDADALRKVLMSRLPTIPGNGWESNTIGNHDRPRAMSLFADGKDDQARMRVALAMVMYLWGTPTFYNGEEIGMTNLNMPDIASFRDNLGVFAHNLLIQNGNDPAYALERGNEVGRDRNRTPMQWDNTANGGFSPKGVSTWLPVNPDYAQGVNVAEQHHDETSLLYDFKRLAQVRHENVALRRGDFELLVDTGPVLAFWRRHPDQTCLVALNMADTESLLEIPSDLEIIFSTHIQRLPDRLAPYEVRVLART